MRTLNLGIVAHVDAGKTTLSERLLFHAGALDRVGSVDAGTTQTDSLELEVERGLGVLDGAILVVSAVEGVQPQTPLLFRALQRLRVPTLIFVNKIDRAGADPGGVVETVRRRLSPSVVTMERVVAPGSRDATVEPFPADD